MKKLKLLGAALLMLALPLSNLYVGQASAATIAGETFGGVSTPANTWISGGTTGACLTAATSSAANSIPACPSGPLDTVGNGALRLTRNANNQSGFAIYNSPVSASQGLDISFDMFQYGGTGADGIVFFLIDGSANPTQPGALGGSLGYSNSGVTPGLVGGYVGVGFDRWGNFSNPSFGTNGPGRIPNSITVRGSEASTYDFVSTKVAAGALGVEATSTRATAKRHVRVTISTNNIMSVSVDYNDGQGLRTELNNLNLNTINGAGSLPANFKFGFSAGTGGSNNVHEIQGLEVDPLRPDLSTHTTFDNDFKQGETSAMHITVSNSAAAEATTGLITVSETVPAGLTPLSASGSGWTCNLSGQQVTCTRPGDGGNALQPGSTTPAIDIPMAIADDATGPFANTLTVTSPNNRGGTNTDSTPIALLPNNDDDGVKDSTEAAAPNGGDANDDGDDDATQTNVTSLPNPVTGKYAVLESSGDCTHNSDVSIVSKSSLATSDGNYSYPAGLMNFTLTCGSPGDSATVTQYYYGISDASSLVLRKYDAVNHTYQTVPGASLSIVTIGGQSALKAVYTLTDGGPLDQDGTADGVIVDPAGPALLITATASMASASSGGGSLVDTGLSVVAITTLAASLLGVAIFVSRRHLDPPAIRKIKITFLD